MSSKSIFVVSLAFLAATACFVYGYAVGNNHVWPQSWIAQVRQAVNSYRKFGQVEPLKRVVNAPADASRKRFVVYHPDLQMKGLYVFLVWDDVSQHYTAWLADDTGKQLHAWVLHYERLVPDGPSNGSDMPHAFAVLPDGSLIVGFDNGDVMARIDSCGEPVWIKQGVYHHAVTRADDGSFWTWRGDGTAYGHYNYIENFDGESGKQIRQIGLIEDIITGLGASSYIFDVRPDYHFEKFAKTPPEDSLEDLFHPNDVDILHADMAPMFPGFKTGDLLLSFAHLHLVAVLDPDTLQLKWWSHGPWRFQHDPDFTYDGKISVYDNNNKRGRSEIIRIDPVTMKVSNDLFGGDLRFFSGAMGTHQYLPNGNVLLVVPDEGRILEVTSHGDKVMEFNNLSRSARYNAHVENAQWVPQNYFDQTPSCPRPDPR